MSDLASRAGSAWRPAERYEDDFTPRLATGDGTNGAPEPKPYRYQGRDDWQPDQVIVHGNAYEARRADEKQWADANAAVMAMVRARIPR